MHVTLKHPICISVNTITYTIRDETLKLGHNDLSDFEIKSLPGMPEEIVSTIQREARWLVDNCAVNDYWCTVICKLPYTNEVNFHVVAFFNACRSYEKISHHKILTIF